MKAGALGRADGPATAAGEIVCRMHVARTGFTPVKGGRHRTQRSVLLTEAGPQGDRAFCLVDPASDRCLRTVENPTLLQTEATWDGVALSVALPAGAVTGEPVPTGEVRTVDYWGRAAEVQLVDGLWGGAYSAHLGREVVLGRCAPGEVVYGGAVTLVTSEGLARLSDQVGTPVQGSRFRATFELDTGQAHARVEDDWLGRRLRLGAAEVRITGGVPRCAVIDFDPASGARDLEVMRALTADGDDLVFGVYAEVLVPGRVVTGDSAALAAGAA